MSRRTRPHAPPTPADGFRAAIGALERQMSLVPPEKHGALAKELAALARDLAKETEAEAARAASSAASDPDDLVRQRAEFDAEVERLIEARVAERVAWMAREEG